MSLTPSSFLQLAHQKFDFLQDDFGFGASDRIEEYWVYGAQVQYDSPKVVITPAWNSREGVDVMIRAKADTFWIRPASSHLFHIQELLEIVAPDILKVASGFRNDCEPWLALCAAQLKEHAVSLLRGDLALCEDMLIMRYCNSTKGLPREDYLRIFREETAALPAEDRQQMEEAIASGSPRRLYFLLAGWVHAGKLRAGRFLETLQDFWLQYLQ